MHRSIEILIGRLVTDEDFRTAFRRDPRAALDDASAGGLALNASEIRALLETDPDLWERVAAEVDARLQKASLAPRPPGPAAS
ncbi:MAG: Os1348 family NHLP clan protein [Vicinamibacterales bacterium]